MLYRKLCLRNTISDLYISWDTRNPNPSSLRKKKFNIIYVIQNVVFFFFEKQTHTRERESDSNIKTHHNSTQKTWSLCCLRSIELYLLYLHSFCLEFLTNCDILR